MNTYTNTVPNTDPNTDPNIDVNTDANTYNNDLEFQDIIRNNNINKVKNTINEQIGTEGSFDNQNPNNSDPLDTLTVVNKMLRLNIALSLVIYKQLNNFNHEYIHESIKQIKKKSK
jgi:hypothetical protein